MTDFFMELLWRAPITVATSIISFGVYIGAEYLWKRWLSRRLRRLAQVYEKRTGRREAALVLSVLTDVSQAARDHLQQHDCGGIAVLQVHQAHGFSDREEDWYAFLERVKAQVRRIREEGFTRLYLFTNLPVALSAMVGATLTNGPETIVHHYDSKRYVPVARLTVETVRL